MNENCFSCREFRTDKVFNGETDIKPCQYYPENLPRTRDVVEVYCCEHYDPVKAESIPTPKCVQTAMNAVPFIITSLAGKPLQPVQKYEDIIAKYERRAFLAGFFLASTLWLFLIVIMLIL